MSSCSNAPAGGAASDGAKRAWLSTLAVAIVFISVGIGLTYHHVLTADRDSLAGGYDVHRAVGPLAYFMDYSIHHGEFPLWNPLTLCGMPYVANPITAAFYPGNLIRSVLTFNPTPFKSQAGWVIVEALHLLLMGVGMVFFARDHKLSRGASLVSAFAFIFSAIWIRRASEYHFLTMVGWLPLLLLIERRALSGEGSIRGKIRAGALCGLILGMTFLSGSINIAPYMGITLGAYAVFYRLLHPTQTSGATKGGAFRLCSGDIAFLGVMFVLAGLIGAALLLPGQEFAGFSSRVKDSNYVLDSPHYTGDWLELYQTIIRFPGLKWQVENIRGFGIGALLLMIAGITYKRRKDVLLNLAVFAVLFDCSMGRPWPIATLVEFFSPIQMIASTRAFDFALIPAAILAGMGVDAITKREAVWWLRLLRCLVLAGLGYLFLHSLHALLGPRSFLAMDNRALFIPAAALGVMMLASWTPPARLWRAALVCLVLAEMLVWNERYVPHIILKPGFANSAGRFAGDTELWDDNVRGTDTYQNRHLYALKPAMHGYEPVHIAKVREVLAGDSRGRTYQRSVKNYEITQENHRGNLFLKRSFWLARQYVNGPLRQKHALFPTATTVYLPDATDLPVPRIEDRDVPVSAVSGNTRRVEITTPEALQKMAGSLRSGGSKRTLMIPPTPMPGVHSVLCLEFSNTTPVKVISTFTDPASGRREFGKIASIAVRGTRIIPLQLPLPDFQLLQATITFDLQNRPGTIELKDAYLLADEADENALIHIKSRTADRVKVHIDPLSGPRILSFFDAYYPGWKAYVDGAPAEILKANDAFKAVVLSPGPHEVEFVYRPMRVYAGVGISLVSTLIALGAIYLLRPKTPRPNLSPAPLSPVDPAP